MMLLGYDATRNIKIEATVGKKKPIFKNRDISYSFLTYIQSLLLMFFLKICKKNM